MKIKLKNLTVYILIVYISTLTSIYMFNDYKYIIVTRSLNLILLGYLLVYGVIFNLGKIKIENIILFIINYLNNFPMILFSIFSLGYITFNQVVLYLYFFYKNKIFKKKCYKVLFNCLVLISLLSVIEYLYVQFYGNFNFTVVNNYKEKFGVYYLLGYFNSFLVKSSTGEKMLRLLAIYDEPGYFGTFLGIFILFTKNESKYKIIILYIAGILTLSTAFFYFITMKFFIEGLNLKKILNYIIIGIIIINCFFIIVEKNKVVKDAIVIKVEKIFREKNLNRVTDYYDISRIEKFKKNGNLILGERKFFMNNGGLSIWMEIYKIGFLGLLVNIIIFLQVSEFFSIKNKKVKIFILVALTSIFQRPNILDPTTLICLYCGPINYYFKTKCTKNKLN